MRTRKFLIPVVGLTGFLLVSAVLVLFLARMDVTVDGRGWMRPIHYAELHPAADGRVIEVKVRENDPVKAGDVILRQDAAREQFSLQTVEREIAKAEEDLKTACSRKKNERENAVERMDADVKAAEAEIVRQERQVAAADVALREAEQNPVALEIKNSEEKIRQQEIRVKDAKKDVENSRELYDKGMQSRFNVEKAASALETAESELKVRRHDLEMLKLKAQGLNIEKARTQLEAARAAHETSKAALAAKRKDLEKARIDLRNDDFDRDCRLALNKFTIERDRLKQLIEDKVLRAPIDGIMVDFHVKEGQVLTPAARIGWVYDNSEFLFYANIKQVDMPRAKVGQPVTLYLDALPYRKEGTFDAEVVEVGAVADRPPQELAVTGIDLNSMQGLVICKVAPCEKSRFFRVGFTGLAEVVAGRARVIEVLFGLEDVTTEPDGNGKAAPAAQASPAVSPTPRKTE